MSKPDPISSSQSELSSAQSILWQPNSAAPRASVSIERADGVWLEDASGARFLDATSSGGAHLFGHNHPQISAALHDQLERTGGDLGRHAAIELAERLSQLAPPGLERICLVDNRLIAIETALRLSFQHWCDTEHKQRRHFVTLGNDSAPDRFDNSTPLTAITAPSPDCYSRQAGQDWHSHSLAMFAHMERILDQHHGDICAVLIEPLVQCVGPMRMYHPIYLNRLREACTHFNIHLIADESLVGFGRCGTLFGCEQPNISPDFLCLGASMTGGYQSTSAVMSAEHLTREKGHAENSQAHAPLLQPDENDRGLACRAALAVLDIFENSTVLESNRQLSETMQQRLKPLQQLPGIGEIRQTGLIAAVELSSDSDQCNVQRSNAIFQHGIEHGVMLRPTGNVVYFTPPYISSASEIEQMVDVAAGGIEQALARPN